MLSAYHLPLALLLALSLTTLADADCWKDPSDGGITCSETSVDGWTPSSNTCEELNTNTLGNECQTIVASGGGDPVFNGFMGHKYYVQGRDDTSFAILSMPGHQINGHLSTGLEEDASILYFDGMGVKVGDAFTATLEMSKGDAYAKGEPVFKVTVNGEDLSGHLGSHTFLKYGSGISMLFFDNRFDSNKTGTDNNGVEGFHTRDYLLQVQTPSMVVKFVQAIDTRPFADPKPHLPSPHLDLDVSMTNVYNRSIIAGWMGESASWGGRECPFTRGCLQAVDEAYSVSGLLAHDFSFATFDDALPVTRARKLTRSILLAASSGW